MPEEVLAGVVIGAALGQFGRGDVDAGLLAHPGLRHVVVIVAGVIAGQTGGRKGHRTGVARVDVLDPTAGQRVAPPVGVAMIAEEQHIPLGGEGRKRAPVVAVAHVVLVDGGHGHPVGRQLIRDDVDGRDEVAGHPVASAAHQQRMRAVELGIPCAFSDRDAAQHARSQSGRVIANDAAKDDLRPGRGAGGIGIRQIAVVDHVGDARIRGEVVAAHVEGLNDLVLAHQQHVALVLDEEVGMQRVLPRPVLFNQVVQDMD